MHCCVYIFFELLGYFFANDVSTQAFDYSVALKETYPAGVQKGLGTILSTLKNGSLYHKFRYM